MSEDPATAQLKLGRALMARAEPEPALEAFERALAIRPDDLTAIANRAGALLALGRPAEALADYDRVLAARPDLADVHNNRAAALCELGRYEAALAAFDLAIGLALQDPDALWNKSLTLLRLGRYQEGWRLYENRKRKREPLGARTYPQPAWTGAEPLAGRTVFLHWEQGFGDTLQFIRYAPELARRGARVAVSVQEPLVRLLKQLEPEIAVLGPHQRPAEFDYHAPLMSLPLAFGTRLETIPASPRLAPEPALAFAWAERLGPPGKPRVGLAWRGSPGHVHDRGRSIPLGMLKPLIAPEADWISLQKDVSEIERESLATFRIRDVADALTDFAETAALIGGLDLVITVDTAVAHLAGVMGKPVWILLPFNPDWRWLVGRNDSPWHPSARLFRQPAPGDWEAAIDSVRQALAEAFGPAG